MTLARAVTIALSTITTASVLVGGCTFLAPQPDRSRLFVLTAVGGQSASRAETQDSNPSAATTESLVVGLGPVEFPEYLDRAQMVIRLGSNRVQLSSTEYWAEPLDQNFERVLSQDLAGALGTQRILAFPWFISAPLDFEVPIDVLQFDTDGDGNAMLRVRWALKDVAAKRFVLTRESRFAQPADGSGTEAAVAAMSATVAAFGEEIAEEIRVRRLR
jgi:uncharacterized lipoprotein YmbA